MKKAVFSLTVLLLGLVYFGQAQEKKKDKTLSPYFVVKSKSKKVDQMPLKHTSAEVNIAGVIADVKITQVYENEGEETLEAIYVFPSSTKAAVYAMTMTVGERKLVAKIEERKKARQDYEKAKEEGKTTSLLEQQSPNVFQMNVANILPKDKITVELHYTELLTPSEGVYEFAYPTVVGPRYSEKLVAEASPSKEWVANPYLKEGKEANYTFNIYTVLNAGMPIQEMVCNTHKTQIKYINQNTAVVSLGKGEDKGGNRDYILKYRLTGGKVQTGLLLYEGESAVATGKEEGLDNPDREKFFLMMMQPPKAPKNTQIPPREYVFIVDVSGSMSGFPLDISKKVLENLIGNLRPTDKFNVMLFESSNQMMSEESMPATQANIKKAIKVLDKQRGGGGTRLLPALQNALAFENTKDYSRTFVVITDGYVTVEQEAFDLIRNNLNNANLFAFGIGSSVNRYIIEGMANIGLGEPFIITRQSEAKAVSKRFRQYIENPVLTNIKINYEGFEVYDIEPVSIPDVFAERPIIVYGKYKGQPKGKITLTGLSGSKTYTKTIQVKSASKENNQALPYLWARQKIKTLDDYNRLSASWYNLSKAEMQVRIEADPKNAKRIKEVTDLGLKYNLLTAYTSFIAIDDKVRNQSGENTTVKQALPLPKGVPNSAVGSRGITGVVAGVNTISKKRKVRRSKTKTAKLKETSNQPLQPNTNKITIDKIENEVDLAIEEVFEEKIEVSSEVEQQTKKDKVFVIVEQKPEYNGGITALFQFIEDNLKYPKKAIEAGIEGRVFLQFVVNEDGTLSDIKVTRGLGFGCDKEAIRVLKLTSGQWKAGKKHGKLVKARIKLPVVFDLE